jgi:hypothetical protein
MNSNSCATLADYSKASKPNKPVHLSHLPKISTNAISTQTQPSHNYIMPPSPWFGVGGPRASWRATAIYNAVFVGVALVCMIIKDRKLEDSAYYQAGAVERLEAMEEREAAQEEEEELFLAVLQGRHGELFAEDVETTRRMHMSSM